MKYQFPKGSTSVIVPVFIQDSSSTTGAGLGSLDQTSSIVGGYLRPGATGVALAVDQNVTTEGTYEAPTTAGQVRIGTPANMRTGTYELHLHNDLLASGADAVFITLGGATNMADLIIEIQLTTFNLNIDANTVGEIADGVWDEALTGAAHNGATTAGRRLRQVSDGLGILNEGTAQAGGASTITLAAGASATDDLYHDAYVAVLAGTGAGQIRPIIGYNGTSKVATVSKAWAVNPASGSEYIVAGSSSVDLHTIQDSTSAVDNLKSACDNYDADRGLAGTALPAAAADAAGGVPISDAGGLDLDTKLANTNEVTPTRLSELDAATGGKMANQVDEIRTDTGEIGTAGAGLTDLGGMSTGMKGEVESEANDALVAQKLDHLVAVADADDPVNDSIMAKLAATGGDWSTFVKGEDALQAIRDRGDTDWITGAGGSPPTTLQNTTIATLASQTSFTLTAGSADDDAYNDMLAIIEDQSTSTQKCVGVISDYVGSSKTVELRENPLAGFVVAVGDTIDIVAVGPDIVRLKQMQEGGGYPGGYVWVDTASGVAGTVNYVNGTVFNPVNSIADAKTIADSLGLNAFHLAPGSSITLAANYDGYEFAGRGYTVALGAQSVSGTMFDDAIISGNDDGSNTLATSYTNCSLASSTLGLCSMNGCTMEGNIILAEAGTFDWVNCSSAGSATPSIDVGAAVANTNLHLSRFSGDIEIKNMGQAGTDTAEIEGHGALTINANCTGGTIAIRGHFERTNNGSATIVERASFESILDDGTSVYSRADDSLQEIRDQGDAAWTTGGASGLTALASGTAQSGTASTIVLAAASAFADNVLNGNVINIHAGTGAGQSRYIDTNTLADDTCNVKPNWTTNPAADSQYEIVQGAANAVEIEGSDATDQINAACDTAISDAALALASVCTEARLAELDAANLPTDVAAIPTTAMRGTDNAALAAGVQLAAGQTEAFASAWEASAATITEGTAKAGTLSTTQMSTTLSDVDDAHNGSVLIFKADTTTAALRKQRADISDFENTNGVLTFSAVTVAPSATETFVIV